MTVKIGLALCCHPEIDGTWSYVPPLGLGYLSSYVKKYEGDVEFVVERDADDLIPHKPDFVGLTFVTFNYPYAIQKARNLKETLGCPVICGGPHVSTLPTVLDPVFDVAVLGEGEATFLELVQLWKERGAFAPEDLRKIPGLLFHDENETLERTPARDIIKELDEIPFPDRELIHEKWATRGGIVNIMTSRGCPYDCSFCSTIQHWGRRFRYPSQEYILDEIEHIRENCDPSEIQIFDDLFIANPRRSLELAEAIHERGLHEGIEFRSFVRANLLSDELVEGLAKINMRVLDIGFESGSDSTLDILNKKGCSAEGNLRALKLARAHGVRFHSIFIIGIPGETREDILANFDFVAANADVFDSVAFGPLQVFPGTEIWEQAKDKLGISEHNLVGIVRQTEDLQNERDFMLNRWPYMNEENMPREELYHYYMIGKRVSELIYKQGLMRKDIARSSAPSLESIAENISIGSILKAKAKRRLGGLSS